MRGSATELRNFLGKQVNDKLKKHYAQARTWYIVGFDSRSIILRIEDDNIRFDRTTGRILERVKLK